LNRKCPYHAIVMNVLEAMRSSTTVSVVFMSAVCMMVSEESLQEIPCRLSWRYTCRSDYFGAGGIGVVGVGGVVGVMVICAFGFICAMTASRSRMA